MIEWAQNTPAMLEKWPRECEELGLDQLAHENPDANGALIALQICLHQQARLHQLSADLIMAQRRIMTLQGKLDISDGCHDLR
jgi:hypothetical protein